MQVYVRLPFAETLRAVIITPSDAVATVFSKLGCDEIKDNGGLCLRCCGRTLPLRASFHSAGVSRDAVIELLPRLLGGGGDGGSTGAESRSAYLEMYRGKKHDKVNPEEERLAKWTTCRLSGMPLHPPCVIDELGNLYNKEAMVHALLNKSMPEALGYVTSLKKHLRNVQLHENPSYSDKDGKGVRLACPVTGIPMNGKARFVAVRPAANSDKGDARSTVAHIMSEKAVKDDDLRAIAVDIVGGNNSDCCKIAAVNGNLEVTPVLPTGSDLDSLREATLTKRSEELAAAALKKKKKKVAAESTADRIDQVEMQSLVKKQKVNGESLMAPKHADAKIYNSLFHSKDGVPNGSHATTRKKPHTTTDYMVRGTMKYVA